MVTKIMTSALILFFSFSGMAQRIDTLSIRLISNNISIEKSRYEFTLRVYCLDESIFSVPPGRIVHFLHVDSVACKSLQTVFIYFVKDGKVMHSPVMGEFVPYKNTRRFRKRWKNGLLTVSIGGYHFSPGDYEVYLVYYSDGFQSCLRSNRLAFTVRS